MERVKIHIFTDIKEQVITLIDFLIQEINDAIYKRGFCNVALSGGHSPEALYQEIASPPYRDSVNWEKVFFFFGDERFVPINDPKSNAFMAKKTLFKPLHILAQNVFILNTDLSPEFAAEDYWSGIKNHFKNRKIRFDIQLLGLGINAHTASLFPQTEVLKEQSAGVKAVFVQELNRYRITFTAPLINQSRRVVFLVFGKKKAEAVKNTFSRPKQSEKYPAQLINPQHGILYWFLDDAAASLL